jgi:hypothetical protein
LKWFWDPIQGLLPLATACRSSGAAARAENPYEAPQVDRCENDELESTSVGPGAEQLAWPDKRVLAVALILVGLAFVGPLIMAAVLPAIV